VSKTINIKILGLTLFAVFAFSAVAAPSAFAADEWLASGATIVTELATNTEGEWLMVVLAGGAELGDITCSALFEGTVGPKEIDLVLDLFSLTGTLIEELPGTSFDCTTTNPIGMFCETGLEVLIWADELRLGAEPLTWESLVELMATEPLFLVHFHHVAFELLCFSSAGTNLEFLCEGLTSAAIDNLATGVELLFSSAAPISSEELTCPTSPVAGITIDLGPSSFLSSLTSGLVLAAS
jgi:hypothetical protein